VGTKGWDFDKIFQELSNLPTLKERVIITGYVADEDLAALYSGAMAFVYPSFYEGFGLPPLEAMQCGVPVITSNTSSLPEVVGDAGIMVAPTDADALCQSMLNLYASSDLRSKMSFKSIEQAKKFSWQNCTEQTIGAYQLALNS
jgi:glycosyltransferase involved in cell wall biosynthesis